MRPSAALSPWQDSFSGPSCVFLKPLSQLLIPVSSLRAPSSHQPGFTNKGATSTAATVASRKGTSTLYPASTLPRMASKGLDASLQKATQDLPPHLSCDLPALGSLRGLGELEALPLQPVESSRKLTETRLLASRGRNGSTAANS